VSPLGHVPPDPVPVPPPAPILDPLPYTWIPGKEFVRVYRFGRNPLGFWPGDAGDPTRFGPFDASGTGEPVGLLYAGDGDGGALAESVFRNVPTSGPKRVPAEMLTSRGLCRFRSTRDLRLVDLTSTGLTRLGISRAELIESDARSYAGTAAWARALHAHPGNFDGLYWVSRQEDTARSVVLFADRVLSGDLAHDPETILALSIGEGLEIVLERANAAGITITIP